MFPTVSISCLINIGQVLMQLNISELIHPSIYPSSSNLSQSVSEEAWTLTLLQTHSHSLQSFIAPSNAVFIIFVQPKTPHASRTACVRYQPETSVPFLREHCHVSLWFIFSQLAVYTWQCSCPLPIDVKSC